MTQLPPRHALVIGIDDYAGSIDPLRTAVADARAIAEVFKADPAFKSHRLLVDAKATKAAILSSLEDLQERVDAKSGLVFYYAGHGTAADGEGEEGPQGFLIPQDAQADDQSTWLAMDELRGALAKLPCHHLLVVLDCCYAGSFRWTSTRGLSVEGRPLFTSELKRYLQGTAWQVLTSAAYNEKAADFANNRDEEGEQHSPFAYALLEGLAGDADSLRGRYKKDGVITATELYQYAKEVLQPPEGQWRQSPGLWPLRRENKGEFIFLNPKIPVKTEDDPPLDDAHNPWPRRVAYTEKDAALFFGRDRVVEELFARLEAPRPSIVTVVGASGSGKSSVLRAGVLPRLQALRKERAWKIVRARPLRDDPLKVLEQAERQLKSPRRGRKLLVIDPLEKLFTECDDETLRGEFLKRLRELVTGDDSLRVLLALRSDFEPRLAEFEAFAELVAGGRYKLPAQLKTEEWREIIAEPATERALYFEPVELVEELMDEVIAAPGALPLLSLALARMYRRALHRHTGWSGPDRALNRQDFTAAGGVEGTVHALADRLLKKASSKALRATVRRVMLRMVAFEGWKASRRRIVLRELRFADTKEQKRVENVLGWLIELRLVVADRGTLELAHDALLRSWKPMTVWMAESRDAQPLLRELWRAAEAWERGKRAAGLLWNEDPRLSPAVALREDLNRLERQFVKASVRRKNEEEDARRVAAAGLWMSKEPTLAALVLHEIVNPDQTPGAVARMLEALAAQPLADLILRGHEEAVVAVAFSRDGSQVVTASRDATARVWSIDVSHGEPVIFRGHQRGVLAASFNRDGTQVLTVGEDKAARVWNTDGSGTEVVRRLLIDTFGEYNAAWNVDGTWALVTLGKSVWLFRADGSGKPVVLKGHEKVIKTAVFNAEGTQVVTAGGKDKTARVWDVDGSELVVLEHESGVECAAFNPAGTQIVTAAGNAYVWNVDGSGPVVLEHEPHEHDVGSVTFNADGTKVLTRFWDEVASDSSTGGYNVANHWNAYVWNADGSGKMALKSGSEPWGVWGPVFNVDGTRVLCADNHHAARVWNVEGRSAGEPLFLAHDDQVESAAFSPDGTLVVTASQDRTARVWDATAPSWPIVLRGHQASVLSAAISPDGTRVVTASADATTRLWKIAGPEGRSLSVPAVLRGHQDYVGSAVFSADSTRIVTASSDGTARVWNADGSGEPIVLKGHRKDLWSAVFNTDGTRVVTASSDRTARVWNVERRTPDSIVLKGHKNWVTSAVFSPDGTRVVTVSLDRTARVYRVDGPESRTLAVLSHDPEVSVVSAVFNADGTQILTAHENGYAVVWSADGEKTLELDHGEALNLAAFNRDGTRIVTASQAGSVKVFPFDASEGRSPGDPVALAGHDELVASAAFSPDGTRIVTASWDWTARVWNVDGSGEVVLKGHEYPVWRVVFSPDGTRVLTASLDGTARLWNADGSGQPLVLTHSTVCESAAFSPDGTHVVTSSGRTAKVWLIDPGRLQATIRASTSVSLDPEFRVRYLRESSVQAWKNYAESELGLGRFPQAWGFDPTNPEESERFLSQLSDEDRATYEKAKGTRGTVAQNRSINQPTNH